jgi:hypothetical protein
MNFTIEYNHLGELNYLGAPTENDPRHRIYFATFRRLVREAYPSATFTLSIDRTDAALKVTVDDDDGVLRDRVWELSQRAWQIACEAVEEAVEEAVVAVLAQLEDLSHAEQLAAVRRALAALETEETP